MSNFNIITLGDGNVLDLSQIQSIEKIGNMNLCRVNLKGGNSMTTYCYKELLSKVAPNPCSNVKVKARYGTTFDPLAKIVYY